MTNECLTTIANRFSCRDFTGEPLSDEIMEAILTAGLQAPSAVNRQPWQIIWVKNNDLVHEIEETALDYFRENEDQSTYERILERGNGIFYNAATVLVLTIDKAVYPRSVFPGWTAVPVPERTRPFTERWKITSPVPKPEAKLVWADVLSRIA